MALTFNGLAKTITWSGGALSVRELWSRYVDWQAEGDNSKHGEWAFTIGMDSDDVPLYLYLLPDVTISITNNAVVTQIYDGVLKTTDKHDPFGGAVVNVRYEAPGIAIGYSTSGSGTVDVNAIAAAVLALAQVTPIHADAKKMNGALITGDGSEGNLWRGV